MHHIQSAASADPAVVAMPADVSRYARCIEVSRRVRWEIDRDVIRGRGLDFNRKFLPDGLSKVERLDFLDVRERRLLSQVQGRTYANMFGLVERFIGAKILEVSRDHGLGDQLALEALIRFTDEELKHQELFRRIERMTAREMPYGYSFVPQPNDVAAVVLSKSTWSVLALTCCIELFVLAHYHQSIDTDAEVSHLYRDVFLFHAKEESQHAILDELEWRRENTALSSGERDRAVDDLVALVAALDGLVQMQAQADCDYFLRLCRQPLDAHRMQRVREVVLYAYRWQYIVSGVQHAHFSAVLGAMITPQQAGRIAIALQPIVAGGTALRTFVHPDAG